MTLRNKTPEKILVNTEFLKNAVSDDREIKNLEREIETSRGLFWALLSGLLACLLPLITSGGDWKPWVRVVIILLSIGYGLGTLWFLVRFLQSKKRLAIKQPHSLEDRVIDESKDKIRYTALLIICYQKAKTGEVKFMTEKSGNYIIHCNMDPSKSINDQSESIINYLGTTYNVQRGSIQKITPLSEDPFYSIKPIHEKETQNGFVFYQIRLRKKVKQELVNHRDVAWKSIQEMEEMPELMGRNQDIITALKDNKTKISDSFEDYYGPIHIIWNITNKCPYNCAICATQDSTRDEISTDSKLRILNNIFGIKEKISTLDFAGGDPMCDEEIRAVIMQAINSLGEEHVSVTTTGKGLQALASEAEEETAKLLKKCEITIDASHDNLNQGTEQSSFSRKSSEYNGHNYEQLLLSLDNFQSLIINIPIIDADLNDIEINHLMSKLLKLKEGVPGIHIEAQIIRLMPVGAFSTNYRAEEYQNYNPIGVAKQIKNCVEQVGIPCRFHCSLRVLPDMDSNCSRCSMLERKIAIDCSGNLFACTWGAYLPMPAGAPISQNPFYLGNLTTENMRSILEGQGKKTAAYKRISRDVANNLPKPYCEAVSWFFQPTMEENHDPLSKQQ